jgi:3-methyladenine DNA glycosylase AlkD
MGIAPIVTELRGLASSDKAAVLQRYFKTGSGEYGAGDIFIGVPVPALRRLSKKYLLLPYGDIEELLRSPVHEYRALALFILVERFGKETQPEQQRIYDMVLSNTSRINNWDLVDSVAPGVVGAYLEDRSRKPLYVLAKSKVVWERRLAVVATLRFIRRHQFADTMALVELLIDDEHDLVHKANGWMLREVAKRNRLLVEQFLERHKRWVPRITLRYAIERFPPSKRKELLRK